MTQLDHTFFLFLVQTVIISMTGVIAPGPITAAIIGTGTKSPHAGMWVAIGHGIVEFPLMALVYYGLGRFFDIDPVRASIFTFGGLFMLFMGYDMLRSFRNAAKLNANSDAKPLVAGILLSLGNVYFILWWVAVGGALITKAVGFGLLGVMIFATVHWSCDLVWFYFLSAVSYRGGHTFGLKFQKVVFAVCGVFLLFFGGMFLLDAAKVWTG